MKQNWKGFGTYGTVGLEIALSVLVGLFAGQWLDRKLGAGGWLTLVGFLYGVAAGGRAVWRALKAANREAETQQEQNTPTSRKTGNDNSSPPRL